MLLRIFNNIKVPINLVNVLVLCPKQMHESYCCISKEHSYVTQPTNFKSNKPFKTHLIHIMSLNITYPPFSINRNSNNFFLINSKIFLYINILQKTINLTL